MRYIKVLPILILAALGASCTKQLSPDEMARYRCQQAQERLARAPNESERFYVLPEACKTCFDAKEISSAKADANELLAMAPRFKGDWNYGNAIHDAHIALGRIALRENKIAEAKEHLLQAGKTPGSPQLDTFGPNMSLARDLLEVNERETVLAYFEECKSFWKMDEGRLTKWSEEVKAGKTPDFKASLIH